MYRIFDIAIESELPLRGLPECTGQAPAWTISLGWSDDHLAGFERVHGWDGKDGLEFMTVARCGEDYLVTFGGLARFLVDFGSQNLLVYPEKECPANTQSHLLLDQVIPRVLCHQGGAVLHASAVLLKDGRVLAFTGPSGRGKSTLALAFRKAGQRLLSDDCLLLDHRARPVLAVPAYPSVRLWQDSFDSLFEDGEYEQAEMSEMAHYTRKKQVVFEDTDPRQHGHSYPLAALFVLQEAGNRSDDRGVRVEAIRGSAAIMAIVESLVALDLTRKSRMKNSFRAVGEVAAAVPVYSLTYPRDFDSLPHVISSVTEVIE